MDRAKIIASNIYSNTRAATAQAEDFLQDLANLRARAPGTNEVNYPAARRLSQRYRGWFPASFPRDSAFMRRVEEDDAELTRGTFAPELTQQEKEERSLGLVFSLAAQLRKAWDEPNARIKERAIFELRKLYDRGIPIDSASPVCFDQAMVHFQSIADRAKHCPNPDCLNPYFIAAKRSYKYCRGNQDCAATAQRLSTRKWWSDHGTQWRKSREAAQKKPQKKKGPKHAKR
jgi:hypothetical protein